MKESQKQNIRKARLGKPHPHKGQAFSFETRKKIGETQKSIGNKPPSRLGWKHSEESKKKIATWSKENCLRGEDSPWWAGGLARLRYPREFNYELKLKIRTRDNFTCCLCKRTEREELEELNRVLAVNHIDFDKNNCKEDNLNTLCLRCNIKINRDREYWTNYFNV